MEDTGMNGKREIASALMLNCRKVLSVFLSLSVLMIIVEPAMAATDAEGLVRAHAEALKQYQRKGDTEEAVARVIKILEAAGIQSAAITPPQGISDETFANILNDYAFFLEKQSRLNDSAPNWERHSRLDEAVEMYRKTTALNPKRAVAFLNLGDCLRYKMSRADSFGEKIALTKEIKAAYLQYKKLKGKTAPAVESFMRLNVIDKPVNDFCEYVTAYANEGRLGEVLGMGKSVKKKDGTGNMRVEITSEGSAHRPAVKYTDNQSGREIEYREQFNTEGGIWVDNIGIVPFGNGHHLLYYDNGGYVVASAPVGFAEKSGRICKFKTSAIESFEGKTKDAKLCGILQSVKHPPFIRFSKSRYLKEKDFNETQYGSNWTTEDGAAEIDFDNDGRKETLVLLNYESGAGAGCGYKFFELLNGAKNGFESSKRRELLLQMQGVKQEAGAFHPVPHCRSNVTGWFVHDGITYYETKYPGKYPENRDQHFHTVSYIKDGKIYNVCASRFKPQAKVRK